MPLSFYQTTLCPLSNLSSYHYLPFRLAKIQKFDNILYWCGCVGIFLKSLSYISENVNCGNPYGEVTVITWEHVLYMYIFTQQSSSRNLSERYSGQIYEKLWVLWYEMQHFAIARLEITCMSISGEPFE